MKPLRYAGLWWTIGLLLALFVMVLSLLPPGEGGMAVSDKLLHFLTYAFLAGWFASLSPRAVLVFVLVVAWSGMIELLQGLTPQRQPEWPDLLANAAGAVIGTLTAKRLPRSPFAMFETWLWKGRHEY